jgi:hypothetical protein
MKNIIKHAKQGRRILKILCYKGEKYLSVCEPIQRKRPSMFPKWFCHQCHRFVLPDKWHKTHFEEYTTPNQ